MCDTLSHVGSDGTLFAKNSDRPLGEVQLIERFPARPAGGTVATQYLEIPDAGSVAVLGSRPVWLWGVEHGINEHGVALGNVRTWTTDDPDEAEPALIGMDLVRLALEQARSADHAVDLVTTALETFGQGGIADATAGEAYFSSFLVADAEGSWVIDTSGRRWVASPVRPGHGAAISNALSIGTEWTRASTEVVHGSDFRAAMTPADLETGHADVRRRATSAVAAHQPTMPELVALLRDHGGRGGVVDEVQPLPDRQADFDGTGVSVCMHIRGFEATAAAMIAQLPRDDGRLPRVRCALGSPCVSLFVPAFVDLGPPAALGEPAIWRAFDELRDAVEQITDGIGADEGLVLARAIRAVIDPIEQALDEAADAADDEAPSVRVDILEEADRSVRQVLVTTGGLVHQLRDALPPGPGR